MKNHPQFSRRFMVLSALAVFLMSVATTWGCPCSPPCGSGSCRVCIQGVCVSPCLPDQDCVNGVCQYVGITYIYDEVGNRINMTDRSGTTLYAYDYLGRVRTVTDPNQKTITYQYDDRGNRSQMTDPNGGVTNYSYDDDHRLFSVAAPAGTTTYHYDALGRMARADYPNGTYTEYTYDSQRNWLVSLTNKAPGGSVLSSFSYTYDNVGNRMSMTENGGAVTYGYDDLYRLTSEIRTGSNAYSITYQYDAVGNRTQKVKDGVTTNYTYNNKNQLQSETTGSVARNYAYDNNGNCLSKIGGGATTTYTWDWNNRLLAVSEPNGLTAYAYDGDGTRISKTQGGVQTKYINDVAGGLARVLMETDNSGVVQAVYNAGKDLISMVRAGAYTYYLHDGLGSTRQLTDAAGAVTVAYMNDAFGNLVASTGGSSNPYGFTGEPQFGEADSLVFLRARYYQPATGRFLSRDPIGYRDGMNLYVYVKNRPTSYIDPSGLVKLPSSGSECRSYCTSRRNQSLQDLQSLYQLGLAGIENAKKRCKDSCDQVFPSQNPGPCDPLDGNAQCKFLCDTAAGIERGLLMATYDASLGAIWGQYGACMAACAILW